ncbi:thioredoxin domain-containing protein [Telluribacter humicola]|uniref:hypothetical protein n=1 Tax=Telluribacter humicola TaxID=1720261 RepID=UPI001A959857|nr:hypothetical protein [Telluribacter humicola]
MKVHIKQTCPACQGSGKPNNPAWEEFKQWSKTVGVRTLEQEHHKMKELGLTWDGPNRPSNTCTPCKGTGEIEQWVELEEIAPQLSSMHLAEKGGLS